MPDFPLHGAQDRGVEAVARATPSKAPESTDMVPDLVTWDVIDAAGGGVTLFQKSRRTIDWKHCRHHVTGSARSFAHH